MENKRLRNKGYEFMEFIGFVELLGLGASFCHCEPANELWRAKQSQSVNKVDQALA